MEQIFKYPRTRHLRGSRFQPGDEDLADVPFGDLADRHLVVEEKLDGANSAISFDDVGELCLQSRGHRLSGGPRERQFDLFKSWANARRNALQAVLGQRYVMYGEWMYGKHTIFYNALPHYFIEFDVLDKERMVFLDTDTRQQLLSRLPFIHSAPVLYQGTLRMQSVLMTFLRQSHFIRGKHLEQLRLHALANGMDAEQVVAETDATTTMEGLYLKVEEDGQVQERYKFVRHGFLQAVEASESHWMDRPLLPNKLAPGVDLFH